jgi:hypothetical protein
MSTNQPTEPPKKIGEMLQAPKTPGGLGAQQPKTTATSPRAGGCGEGEVTAEGEHRTSNIEHRTSNIEHRTSNKITATSPQPSPPGAEREKKGGIQWRIFFEWHDPVKDETSHGAGIWIGVFIQRKKRRMYACLIPFCGVCFYAGPKWERGTFGGRAARRHWWSGKVEILANDPPSPSCGAARWMPMAHPERFVKEGNPVKSQGDHGAGIEHRTSNSEHRTPINREQVEDLNLEFRRALDRQEREAIRAGGGPIQKKAEG